MKKVLLLTGSFGNGHIQVSNSLKDEFKKNSQFNTNTKRTVLI